MAIIPVREIRGNSRTVLAGAAIIIAAALLLPESSSSRAGPGQWPEEYEAIGQRNPFEYVIDLPELPPPPPPIGLPPPPPQPDPKIQARLNQLKLTGIVYWGDHYEAVFHDLGRKQKGFVNGLRLRTPGDLSAAGKDMEPVKVLEISDEDDMVVLEYFGKRYTYELRGGDASPAPVVPPGPSTPPARISRRFSRPRTR